MSDLSRTVKQRASALGFDLCGIAIAKGLDPAPLEKWLSRGWGAGLAYMKARIPERLDPRLLLPGAKSVVVVAASYAAGDETRGLDEPKGSEKPNQSNQSSGLIVARYARGRDYHNVLLKPLRKLASWMRRELEAQV